MGPLPSSCHRYHTIAASLFALVLAVPLAAQSPAPGSRVRVSTTAFPNEWLTGTVTERNSEALWLGDRKLLVESITRLEVADGKRGQFGRGLRIGAIAGTTLGLLVVLGAASEDDGSLGGSLGTGVAVIFLPVFAAVGAATGGLIGAVSRTDRWTPVPVASDRIRVTLQPTSRGGLAMGVGVSF